MSAGVSRRNLPPCLPSGAAVWGHVDVAPIHSTNMGL